MIDHPTSTDPTFPIIHTSKFLEYIRYPPSLEEATKYLKQKYGERTTDEEIRKWYDLMSKSCWIDKQGHTIRNWAYCFYAWRERVARYSLLEETRKNELALSEKDLAFSEEMHTLRKQIAERKLRGEHTPPRADNYIRADEEQIERFKRSII